MQDTSCLVLPIPAHTFFKQTVLQGQIGHHLLQCGGLTTKKLHPPTGRPARRGGRPPAPTRPPPPGARRPPEIPSTSRNTSRRQCLRGGTVRRCSPRRVVLPARCGFSPPPSTADESGAECPLALVLPALCPVRISLSSSLLAATMNQKSSLREVPRSVSWLLTGNTALLVDLAKLRASWNCPASLLWPDIRLQGAARRKVACSQPSRISTWLPVSKC